MNTLKHIEINIGKACNNKCIFCMSGKVRFDPLSQYKNLVATKDVQDEVIAYAQLGYKSIGFLGGDISIHPGICEILKTAKDEGFLSINVISNGMLLENKDFLGKLINSGMTRINFSIHSHMDSIEDSLTQVPGGLQRKLKAIDNCNYFLKKGLLKSKISINLVLNKQNYTTVVKTCLYFFFKKEISDIRINFVQPDFGMEEYFDDFVLKYSDIGDEIRRLIQISLRYNIRITFDTIPPCIFKKSFPKNYRKVIKNFLGEQYDHIDEISDLSSGRKFNWQEKKEGTLKHKGKRCEGCVYSSSCQGIWREYNELFGDDEVLAII